MPGLNRRGPEGEGAMTGRGRGLCNTANKNGQTGRGLGRGLGRGVGGGGRGCGMGMRRGGQGRNVFADESVAESGDELALLKSRENTMKNSLDSIKKRISQLEAEE